MVIYPKSEYGHALNIRYNSSRRKIQFVDAIGAEVDFIREKDGKKIIWSEFKFSEMKKVFVYSYKHGNVEYGTKKKQK